MVIEKLLFSSALIKTKLFASNETTANNHFASSESFFGEMEKVFICLVSLKSSVSCGFVFFVQLTYLYVF